MGIIFQEQSLVEKFRSQGGAQVKEFCQFGTAEECMKTNGTQQPCDKLHFKKIIHKHTDGKLAFIILLVKVKSESNFKRSK